MRRSCGDDVVDHLVEQAERLHEVTGILVTSNTKSLTISVKDIAKFDLGRSTPEACECAVAIRVALKKYKQSKLRRLRENTSDGST